MHSDTSICKLCSHPNKVLHGGLPDRIGHAKGFWDLFQCTNTKCGLISINPMPDATTLTDAYESYYTHNPTGKISGLRKLYLRTRNHFLCQRFHYPTKPEPIWIRAISYLLALIPHRRIALESLVLWLPWKPNGQLLEIGCSNGERLELLRDLGWKVAGLEPDPKAARLAIAKQLSVFTGKLRADIYPPESFDAILMSHVIEHVPNPQEIIAEALCLLRPDGVLIMLTPNSNSLGHRWFGRNWLHLDAPRHLHLFNRDNLLKLCRDAGFTEVHCTSTARDAQWTLGASLALKRHARYVIGQLPIRLKLLGLCLFYFEWLMLLFWPQNGEEILMTAQRPTTDLTLAK